MTEKNGSENFSPTEVQAPESNYRELGKPLSQVDVYDKKAKEKLSKEMETKVREENARRTAYKEVESKLRDKIDWFGDVIERIGDAREVRLTGDSIIVVKKIEKIAGEDKFLEAIEVDTNALANLVGKEIVAGPYGGVGLWDPEHDDWARDEDDKLLGMGGIYVDDKRMEEIVSEGDETKKFDKLEKAVLDTIEECLRR